MPTQVTLASNVSSSTTTTRALYRRTADQRTAVTTHVLGSLQVYGTRLLIHSAIRRCGAIGFPVTGMAASPTPHSLMAQNALK